MSYKQKRDAVLMRLADMYQVKYVAVKNIFKETEDYDRTEVLCKYYDRLTQEHKDRLEELI